MRRALTYADFQPVPVVLALASALCAGFPLAIAVAGARVGWWEIGPWWPALMQAHGHAQLAGFAGLFVIGVGAFFFPRLRGAPLAYPPLVPWSAGLLAGGVLLRVIAQLALALAGPSSLGAAALALSAALEIAGVGVFLVLIAATVRHGRPPLERRGMTQVFPLLGGGFLSFAAAIVVWGIAAIGAARAGRAVLDGRLDAAAIALLLDGFLSPIAFAVSVQALPLFLRLPAWRPGLVLGFATLYLPAMALHVASTLGLDARVDPFAELALSGSALAFIVWSDIVVRTRSPWTTGRAVPPIAEPTLPPTRPGMPDRGEYGRFEWLVRGAFAWLAVAYVARIANALAALLGSSWVVPTDGARHAQTMGFVTLLICGMSVRMIPGFAKRRLRFPGLVAVLAATAHAATLARVLPAMFPRRVPGALFGLSGPLAFVAIVLLAVMLLPTMRSSRTPRSRQDGDREVSPNYSDSAGEK